MTLNSNILRSLALLVSVFVMSGCTCGFDCSSNDDSVNGPALLTLGFSDALPDDLKEVVLEVDSIVFKRTNDTDIEIDSFSGIGTQDPNQPEASFTIDLLNYRGVSELLVIQSQELEAGTYSNIVINLTDESAGKSNVLEDDDTQLNLVTDDGGLVLPGFTLSSGAEKYTIEFDLALSLRFEASNDRYRLSSNGIRVVDSARSGAIIGVVDNELFDGVEACSEKTDPLKGNRVYLYEGIALAAESLGDVFTDDNITDFRAPLSVSTIKYDEDTGLWRYFFSFLPADNYTVAFTCDALDDDPDALDQLSIPLPTDQIYEVNLSSSETLTCNITADNPGNC